MIWNNNYYKNKMTTKYQRKENRNKREKKKFKKHQKIDKKY